MTTFNTTRLINSLEKVVEGEGSVIGNRDVTPGLTSWYRHGTSQKLRRKMLPERKEI